MRYSKGRALGGGIFDNKEIPDFLYTFKLGKGVVIKLHFLDPEVIFLLFISFRTYPPCTSTGAGFLRMDGTVLRFVCLPSIISFHTSLDSFFHAPTCSFLSIYLLIMFLALLIIFGTLIRNATIFRLEKANGDCSCSL
jgi:hypothetical protein